MSIAIAIVIVMLSGLLTVGFKLAGAPLRPAGMRFCSSLGDPPTVMPAVKKIPITLLESDLTESFVKGSGPGGQKINKSSNRVVLTHTPSGLTVSCQDFRDLTSNRKRARSMMLEKLDFSVNGALSKRAQQQDKVRRRKQNAAKKAKRKYGGAPKADDNEKGEEE